MRPPLPLRGISPGGGEKLLPFMEFLPPPVGVAEEPALQSGAEGGNKISKNTWTNELRMQKFYILTSL